MELEVVGSVEGRPMTIKNETRRREIRALIQAQILLPNDLEDQLVQRRIGRVIAAFGEARASENVACPQPDALMRTTRR
jgi:hypothetical protein